tara:strand:+ start:843 stop:974 length:132 start_codon:yes stop_codon:yes gene_type:complete
MDFYLFVKFGFILGVIIALYLTLKNIDVIKIILNYWKDKLFGK